MRDPQNDTVDMDAERFREMVNAREVRLAALLGRVAALTDAVDEEAASLDGDTTNAPDDDDAKAVKARAWDALVAASNELQAAQASLQSAIARLTQYPGL